MLGKPRRGGLPAAAKWAGSVGLARSSRRQVTSWSRAPDRPRQHCRVTDRRAYRSDPVGREVGQSQETLSPAGVPSSMTFPDQSSNGPLQMSYR